MIMFRRNAVIHGLVLLILISALIGGCESSSTRPTTTPVALPTATLKAGWDRVKGKGVSISLPDTFVGGDLSEKTKKAIAERTAPTDKSPITMLEALEQVPNQQPILLFAVDTKPSQPGSLLALTITGEPVSAVLHPLTHLESYARQLPQLPFAVRSKEERSIAGNPAGRMIIEWGEKGARQVLYAIRVNTLMYVVGFSVPYDQYKEMLPIFEQSIQTFSIEP
jgi:hypothetical protein